MSTENNKALVRRYFDAINAGQLDVFSQDLFAPEFRLHFDGLPELDRDGGIGLFGSFLSAFPDIQHDVIDQIAEGDQVPTRITVRGTHRGDFNGIPPTGKDVDITATNVHRVANAKIVELWVNADQLGMLQQIWVVPSPGQK